MEWRIWWPEERPYIRALEPRILLKIETNSGVEKSVEDGIMLRYMLTTVRSRDLGAPVVAASDQRFTYIFVLSLFGLSRARLPCDRVCEGNTVRTPFEHQEEKKGERTKASHGSFQHQLAGMAIHQQRLVYQYEPVRAT
jgi:hypothetical protein